MIALPPDGIWLDLGCGASKQPHTIGLDRRALPGVDIVHDLEVLPYPLPDACCYRMLASHIVEHLNPALVFAILDEWWRLMRPHGQLLIATPYAGSPRFWQDPSHRHGWMEATAQYFDPDYPLWKVYEPRPWKIEENAWHSVHDLNIILSKRPGKQPCEGADVSSHD